jgi:hypothetical protein
MKKSIALFLVTAPLLAACEGNMQQSLGLNREAPDEFTVVSRPPLSVPPEFTLRPPRPGETPEAISADSKARSVLLSPSMSSGAATAVSATDTPSTAAASLLRRAGADSADSSIREKLGVDARTPLDTSNAKTLLEQLRGKEKREPTVDAEKEVERLRSNKEAGKPITEGETPQVDPGSESLLDRVF